MHVLNYFAAMPLQLRLQGPSRRNGSGWVQVFYQGKWGTICSKDWDMREASVVCRQLGFKNGVALKDYVIGGTGPIWLDEVRCSGREEDLNSCRLRTCCCGDDCTRCHTSRSSGVECFSTGTKQVIFRYLHPIYFLIKIKGHCV